MVALAIADNPAFELSRAELDRPGPSYLVETLEWLTGALPGDELVFILSAQALYELPTWREPRRIVELARLAVAPRLGYRRPSPEWVEEHLPGLADRIVMLDGPELGLSASAIRRRAGERRSIRYLVPREVERYIETHQLYRVRIPVTQDTTRGGERVRD